ncbi:MAG: isoprenylcysteine carboxylmethyltransferase family protein [Blastocatellia bacterium]
MASRFELFLQRYRVLSGFIIAAIYIIFARPSLLGMQIGFSIAALGLAIRFWAAGHIRKGSELDLGGPYAYTRNPLYFGSFLLAAGFGIASGVWWLAAVCIAFFISIYFPVIRVETRELFDVFGAEYENYRRSVPLFFPRLAAVKKSERKFDFGLYLKNGEYNVTLGAAAACAFLLARYYRII